MKTGQASRSEGKGRQSPKFVRLFRLPRRQHVVAFKTAGELALAAALHHLSPDDYEVLLERRLSGLLMLLVGYVRAQDKVMPLDTLLAAVTRPVAPRSGRIELKPVEDMPAWARVIYLDMMGDCERLVGRMK